MRTLTNPYIICVDFLLIFFFYQYKIKFLLRFAKLIDIKVFYAIIIVEKLSGANYGKGYTYQNKKFVEILCCR